MNESAGLVIPSKNAGARWRSVIDGILLQTGITLDVLLIDSGSTDRTVEQAKEAGFRVIEISPGQFGHGATRQRALELMHRHRWVIYLTQDAILSEPKSLLHLLAAFKNERVAVAYGRQLPHEDASKPAKRLREFNYPEQSFIRTYDDRKVFGIKTAFNSNSFSAYDRERLISVGGFPTNAVVGEDVLACAALLRAGFSSAYVANATVFHSHNYSMAQEFSRYQAIGQMHAAFPDLLRDFGRPEGEGLRLVRVEAAKIFRTAPSELLELLARSAARYLGYRFGQFTGHPVPSTGPTQIKKTEIK